MAESLNTTQQYYIQQNQNVLPGFSYPKTPLPKIATPNTVQDVYTPTPAAIPTFALPADVQDTFTPGRYKEIQSFNIPFNNNIKGKFYQLANGQKVVIVQKPGPTTIKTFIKAGGFNEPERIRGISHFIEHSLFNGSEHLAPQEFQKLTNKMGTSINASTGTNMTNYYISSGLCSKDDLAKLINIHADLIQHPTFPDKSSNGETAQHEKEKDVIAQEIQFRKNNLNEKTYSLVLNNLFNIKTPADILVAGSEENVRNLTRQDVVNYYNKWYTPDNMVTVVVGDGDPDETIKIIDKEFGNKPSVHSDNRFYQPLIPIEKTVRQNIEWPNANSVNLDMGMVGPKNNDLKEKVATEVLSFALAGYKNSRLTKALKPLDTDCNVRIEAAGTKPDDPLYIGLNCEFKPGQEEKALQVIDKVFDEMKYKPLTEDELKVIKTKMKNFYKLSNESSAGIAENIGNNFMNNENLAVYLRAPELIDSITAKDVQEMAKKCLRMNKAAIVMAYPEGKLPKQEGKIKTIENKVKNKFSKYQNIVKLHVASLIARIGPSNNKAASLTDNQVSGNSAGSVQSTDNAEKLSPIKMDQVEQLNLNNNLHALIYDNPDSATSACSSLSFSSPTLPPNKPGVVEFLTFMLLKGSARYSEEALNDFKDRNNLEILPSPPYPPPVGVDGFGLNFKCPNEKLPLALNLSKEILLNPDLSEKNFEKCKNEIKVIAAGLEESSADRAWEALWGNHPLGYNNRLIKENIDKITLQDVKAFYNHVINNRQGAASIVGDLSTTPGLKERVLSSLSTGIPNLNKYNPVNIKTNPIKETRVLATGLKNKKQAEILQIFRGPDKDDVKEQAALSVLSEILGGSMDSRLFLDLRNKQKLAYDVSSCKSSAGSDTLINLTIETSMEDVVNNKKVPLYGNIQKSLEGFKKHIDLMRNEPVSKEELDSAKRVIKNSIYSETELPEGKNLYLAGGLTSKHGPEHINKYINAVEGITAEDVQNAARKYFAQPSIISVVSGTEAINANKDYFKTLGNLTTY